MQNDVTANPSEQPTGRAKHRVRQGRVEYRTSHPDFPTGLVGYEEWTVTTHGDGSRVLRARCELHDLDTLVRDVLQSVDRDYHPQDAFVRLTINDKFFGNALYNFTDEVGEYKGWSAADGPTAGRIDIARGVRGFGTHPVMSDCWLVAHFDLSKGPGIQTFRNNPMSSIDHRGATGPGFTETTTSSLEYYGTESVTVPAGTYDCHHFAFVNTSNNHPPYNMWVSADGDYVFVKGIYEGPVPHEMLLVEDRSF
ncbi:MAG: hypothetical protein ABW169_17640 [Sphingobium sp.]